MLFIFISRKLGTSNTTRELLVCNEIQLCLTAKKLDLDANMNKNCKVM